VTLCEITFPDGRPTVYDQLYGLVANTVSRISKKHKPPFRIVALNKNPIYFFTVAGCPTVLILKKMITSRVGAYYYPTDNFEKWKQTENFDELISQEFMRLWPLPNGVSPTSFFPLY